MISPSTNNNFFIYKAINMLFRKYFWLFWLVTTIVAGAFFYQTVYKSQQALAGSYQQFLNESNLSTNQLINIFFHGNQTAKNHELPINNIFLILGVDTLDGDVSQQSSNSVLTDTIILGNLNFQDESFSLLSLPRDTYLPDRREKINAIYNDARQSTEATPSAMVTNYISNLISEPIQHTLLFTFDHVRQLIDLIGGIEIEVDNTFIDYQYPTSYETTISNTNTSQLSLYETISFEAGPQIMNGSTALKFMRSRHAQGIEGSDLARNTRQQKVIIAFFNQIIPKLFSPSQPLGLNWPLLTQLYQFYDQNFSQDLDLNSISILVWRLINQYQTNQNQNWQFHNQSLPIYPLDPNGILREVTPFEQRQTYQGNWVWVITDWDRFPYIIRQQLNIDTTTTIEFQDSDESSNIETNI